MTRLPKLDQGTYHTYLDAWNDGNNAGRGYAAGTDEDSVNDLSRDFGDLIHRADSNDEIAIYLAVDGSVIGVGDGHGLWAVHVGGGAQ